MRDGLSVCCIDWEFELWIGNAAEIRTKRVRKQKTDSQDAQLLVRLMMKDRFPRIWVADAENRDMRQLLWHRHRLVQMRTRVMNQLHVAALNEGLQRKKALWRLAGRKELESLVLAPWASRRRQDLLDLLDQITPKIQKLTQAVEDEVEKRPVTRRLMTHPGVGPLTALAFELVIGTPDRFHCGKHDPNDRSEPTLESANHPRERNGAPLRVHAVVCSKSGLTLPTLLAMEIYRRLRSCSRRLDAASAQDLNTGWSSARQKCLGAIAFQQEC
jgi:hypothetical protein